MAVGIKKKWKKHVTEVNEVSGRLIPMTLGAGGGAITFISVYAPPADHKTEEKLKFYDDLTRKVQEARGEVYFGGDFNARPYERLEHEKEVIGTCILERKEYITTQEKEKGVGDKTRENRNCLIDFLGTNDMCAVNTMLENDPCKPVTYKEKVPENNPVSEEYTGENTGPYNCSKYAQYDYLLIKQERNHTIKDCKSKIDWYRDSDHIPIHAKIMTNMKKCEPKA